MTVNAKILLFDEDLKSLSLLTEGLDGLDITHEIKQVKTLSEFIDSIDNYAPDAVLINYNQSSYEGLTALALARKKNPSRPFVYIFTEDPLFYQVKSKIISGLPQAEFLKLTEAIKDIFLKEKERVLRKEAMQLTETELKLEQEKEQKARLVLAGSPDLIIEYNGAGDFVCQYKSPDSPISFPVEKFSGKNLNDLLADGDVTKLSEESNRTFESYEFRIPESTRTEYYLLRILTLNEERLIVYISNISREKEIRSNLNRFHHVISASSDIIFFFDENWEMIVKSSAALTLMTENKIGNVTDATELIPILIPGLTVDQILVGMDTQNTWSSVFRFKDAEKRDRVSLVTVSTGGNTYTEKGFMLLVTDLTVWHEKEKEHAERGERYKRITENLNLGIVALRDSRIYYSNEFFCQLIDAKAADIFDTNIRDLIVKEDRKIFDDAVQGLLSEEIKQFTTEIRFLHSNSITVINSEIMLKLANFDGAFTIFCVIKDISEVKLQELLYITENKERAENSGKILSPRDHTMRTALNGILGFAEIIKERFKDQSEEEFLNFSDQILKGGKQLVEILDLYPSLNKPSETLPDMDITNISLSDLLSKALENVRGQNSGKEIRLNFLYSSKIEVLADEKKISEILISLLKNSLDSPVANSVNVETGFESKKGKAYIRIKDSGLILEDNQYPLLFKPMAAEVTKKFPGLYSIGKIVYPSHRIISRMNGEMVVSGTAESGTVITIYLPIPEQGKSSGLSLTNPMIAVSSELIILSELNPSILIVEDDPGCCKMLQVTFRNIAKTDTAINGTEALEFIAAREAVGTQYDLLLLDIGLPPPWDGVELRQEILKRYPKYENVPIIAETAYAMKNDMSRITAAGFDGYIAKPIDRRYMIKTLVAALKQYNKL